MRPRALFSPDSIDVTDCHSLNISSDIENLKTFKTPKCKGGKILETSKISVDSPQSPYFTPRRTKDDGVIRKSCSAGTLLYFTNLNDISNTDDDFHILQLGSRAQLVIIV